MPITLPLAYSRTGDLQSAVSQLLGLLNTQATDFNGLGTMSVQDATAVAITGGTVDATVIGGGTPAAASVTTLNATGIVTSNATGVTGYQATGALNGGTVVNFYRAAGTVGATVTNTARCYTSTPSTNASAFTLGALHWLRNIRWSE